MRDTHGALVVANAELLADPTLLTRKFAKKLGKPCLVVTPKTVAPDELVRGFMKAHRIRRLNVAGPWASKEPGIGEFTKRVLSATFC